MMEKLKSITLTLLVFTSLLQSYLLAYSTPNFDLIHQTEYVERELIGTQEELHNLVFPEQIVLHFGDETHTVLYPEMNFYKMIYQNIKQRAFDGLRPSHDVTIQWDEYRNKHQGVEIRFEEAIPLTVLQRIMQIRVDESFQFEAIDRIWILSGGNEEEIRAYFFADASNSVYESTKADFIVKDIERFVGLGSYLTTYSTIDGSYYMPDKPIHIVAFRADFDEFTTDQLSRSLFVDPGLTRTIVERDGTEIITDGKRGLRVKQEEHRLVYSDPIAPAENRTNVREDLLSAVQFINQHGGWNGAYVMGELQRNHPVEGQVIVFRQYLQSHPIIPSGEVSLGYIKVKLRKGVVSTYERSLINIKDEYAVIGEEMLPGGKELQQLMNKNLHRFDIESIFPAYRPSITKEYVEFTPEWAIKLRNGDIEYLK